MHSTTQYLLQSDVDISLLGTALVVDDEARTPSLVFLGILLLAFRWGGGFCHQEGVGVLHLGHASADIANEDAVSSG